MKIKNVQFESFKRFTSLSLEEIPRDVRLVILAGPNGSGKSSFFEGLYTWFRLNWSNSGQSWDRKYHEKHTEEDNVPGEERFRPPKDWSQLLKVNFHEGTPQNEDDRRKALYVRSAYRNDPAFQLSRLERMESPLREARFSRFSQNDVAVTKNYQRLVSQGFRAVYMEENPSTTIGDFREKSIGEIRASMRRLFPDLVLNDFGDPIEDGTFFFDKGTSKAFSYENLSGGEKAAFDLILDIIVKRKSFDDTVYCIDEPEAHMNMRLQASLLNELFYLIPENCQLWLATHSVGMMRRARDIASQYPGQVAFLDFGDKDFDKPVVLKPERPTRAFWQRVLDVALDDLSALVAPEHIVVCEGALKTMGAKANVALDAECYNRIFEPEYPGTTFISVGNSHQVETDRIALIEAMKSLIVGAKITRLIDGDDHSPEDITDRQKQGIQVLSRRNLESYLFDDEVLAALCESIGMPECTEPLLQKNKRQ